MSEWISLAKNALNLYERHIRVMELRERRMQEFHESQKKDNQKSTNDNSISKPDLGFKLK